MRKIMLRGINRSIIEINETENKYFEKIIVFVRPEFGNLSNTHLEREAVRLVGNMSTYPFGTKKRISARKRAEIKRKKIALFFGGLFVISALAIVLWAI
jgi:hypothetical protein